MSLSNAAEAALIDLIYLNTAFANIGNAGGLQPAGAAGNLYLALHTADPGEAGDQSTSESAYTSYARVAIPRTSGGWTRTGSVVSNTALVQFPISTGGTSTITHWSVGTLASGAGVILAKGALSASKTYTTGDQPQIAAGALQITAD